ncbi:RNase H domain-containing protein [Caerostris darwini]|uniref:RNase H domain-containing protein n=1 Tax=Caerostris darwini TaxID=1538125 RepID=A0AAV4T860_9ARAC|nr:RNase H domain-containing protein [Caerostris darwini]
MNGRLGGAFVVYSNSTETHSETFRLSDHETVYSAELVAVKQAINFAIDARFPTTNIISDSRSVLQALENINNTERDILAIKHLLVNHEGAIRLFWIKAHAGFIDNERAHEYAKCATSKEVIDFSSGYSLLYMKKLIKKKLLERWQDRWSSFTKGKEVFAIFPEVKTSRIQEFYIN